MSNILITGASSGLGKELANIFFENNIQPILVGRDLKSLQENFPQAKNLFALDLTNATSVQNLITQFKQQFTSLDAIFCCAGLGDWCAANGTFDACPVASIFDTMNANATGTMALIAGLSTLLYASTFERKMLCVISSTCASTPSSYVPFYSASKVALETFVECTREQLEKHNTRVLIVRPGRIANTRMSKEYKSGVQKPMMQPDELAYRVYQEYEKKDTVYAEVINLIPAKHKKI